MEDVESKTPEKTVAEKSVAELTADFCRGPEIAEAAIRECLLRLDRANQAEQKLDVCRYGRALTTAAVLLAPQEDYAHIWRPDLCEQMMSLLVKGVEVVYQTERYRNCADRPREFADAIQAIAESNPATAQWIGELCERYRPAIELGVPLCAAS